jgi:integrase/recombinase XerD
MRTLDELLGAYAGYLHGLNRRPKTVRQYVTWTRRFFAFARGLGVRMPSDVSASHLQAYQQHLAEHPNSRGHPHSVKVQNQHLLGIAMFLRYLCAEGRVASDPSQSFRYAKVPQQLPRHILTVAEVRRLLQAPDVASTLGYRDRTIMEVLYSTGIRRQELLNLAVNDLDLEAGLLTVRQGKGGKDRVVPMGRIAAQFLENYLSGIRPELLGKREERGAQVLFLSVRGLPLSKSTLAERLEIHRRAAGLAQPLTPHVFRHTCATHMVCNGANVRHVQEMLGHVSLDTTQMYLHLSISDLKEAHGRAHPREREE